MRRKAVRKFAPIVPQHIGILGGGVTGLYSALVFDEINKIYREKHG
jgi:pyruvate/2-oxoglutarate dehydrogenase complex dihydrolipoamide dehydrogenase (E3) component